MSMKNSGYTIENQNHDLPTSSAVAQPTATPECPAKIKVEFVNRTLVGYCGAKI